MVTSPTNFGWQLCGGLFCGLILAVPVFFGYFLFKLIKSSIERRREKAAKKQSVTIT